MVIHEVPINIVTKPDVWSQCNQKPLRAQYAVGFGDSMGKIRFVREVFKEVAAEDDVDRIRGHGPLPGRRL